MHADILIKGGTVVDPSGARAAGEDIVIRGDRIVAVPAGEAVSAETVVDASGCIVTPGLIDHHAHVFYGGTAIGCDPDLSLFPMGITTVVDAGSVGVDAAEAFLRGIVFQSRMRILLSLNVSSEGMTTKLHTEDLDPDRYDAKRLQMYLSRYPDLIFGLKIRCSVEIVGEHGMRSLERAIELAGEMGCSLTVHVTNPPCDLGDLAEMLRPGDVICHVYHGSGSTILDPQGRVKEKIRAARARGVLFDTADGRRNHSQAVTRAAIADGFYPDIISTDLVAAALFRETLFGLPVMMSKYLAFGMPLVEVVRACTETPARVLGLAGKIGTLAPGALADVTVFSMLKTPRTLANPLGESMTLPEQVVPQMTIHNGEIVFRQVSFL